MDEEPAKTYQPGAWWFVVILLLMFAALMASHVGMLWVRVRQCDQYAQVRLDAARAKVQSLSNSAVPAPPPLPPSELCKALSTDFNSVANLYLATILALLSGAGFSAGTAYTAKPKPRKDEPP